MLKLSNYEGFDWDEGNIDKSYKKHGVKPSEAEETFLDEKVLILRDVRHSQKEKRYILIGKNTENKILFIVFTLRRKRIRIISVRKANRKEKNRYEK
jgi:uncharacterized protein